MMTWVGGKCYGNKFSARHDRKTCHLRWVYLGSSRMFQVGSKVWLNKFIFMCLADLVYNSFVGVNKTIIVCGIFRQFNLLKSHTRKRG